MKKYFLLLLLMHTVLIKSFKENSFSAGLSIKVTPKNGLVITPFTSITVGNRIKFNMKPSFKNCDKEGIQYNGFKIDVKGVESDSKVDHFTNLLLAYHTQKFITYAQDSLYVNPEQISFLKQELVEQEINYKQLLEIEDNNERKEKIKHAIKKINLTQALLEDVNYAP